MRRKLSVAQAIQNIGRPVFTTREISSLRGASLSSTSQTLDRMAQRELIVRATRGLWCIPNDPRFSLFSLVPFLAGRHRAYVSFFSALHLHGLIEPIPQLVYAATTAHTRITKTPIGTYSFHRIHPSFFIGFDWYGHTHQFLIASPEKAVVDCLYLSSRKGRRFKFLPALDVSRRFSFRRARAWAQRIDDPRVRVYVLEELDRLRTRYKRAG